MKETASTEVHVRSIEAGALVRLSLESLPLQVAWFDPSEAVWAVGFGIAVDAVSLPPIDWKHQQRPPCGPWFGGWAFDAQRNWTGFPSERWVLPKVLVWKDRLEVYAAVFGEGADEAAGLLSRLGVCEDPTVVTMSGTPKSDRAHWNASCGEALAMLETGELSKLVLARRLSLEAESAFDIRRVLKRLEVSNSTSVTFLMRGKDGTSFVGATPEVLCRSEGRRFQSEALAGTATAGDEAALFAPKNLAEHRAVVDAVTSILERHSVWVNALPQPTIKKAGHLLHLQTPIEAQLTAGADALDIARTLHPTPAVAGTPRVEAMAFLRRREGFDRGWYAGAIGHRNEARVDLRVALRSARIDGIRAEIFVGAGLVRGSTVESEWAETSAKAKVMLDALGFSP